MDNSCIRLKIRTCIFQTMSYYEGYGQKRPRKRFFLCLTPSDELCKMKRHFTRNPQNASSSMNTTLNGVCSYANAVDIDPDPITFQYAFSSSTCAIEGNVELASSSSSTSSSEITSSSSIAVIGTMTAGDLMVSFLIFCAIVLYLGNMIAQGLSGFNTKKKYINYSKGSEVEITENM